MVDESSSDATRVGGGLLLAAEPDPHALQGMFALLIAIGVIVRTLGGETFTTDSAAGLAVVVTLARQRDGGPGPLGAGAALDRRDCSRCSTSPRSVCWASTT